MSLKSRSKRPPTGWVYQQSETGWNVKKSKPGELISAIVAHRLANNLKRTSIDEVWEDAEAYICGLLNGKFALWDFCNTKIPRPMRSTMTGAEAEAVIPFPVRGYKPEGSGESKADQVKTALQSRKKENAKAKREGKPPKRPCKTCGKRKSN